ncbi:8542_t:CDS:2 [Ambispora gerdemannii]|uniref:8542_t:CDS:1 n=1 Tax=Ambispora gerdemannii TaxID=144530 RepID=A0A9N9FKN0_9GLOM|nr:8542_t:CDS:2 [Ambispora gerdemannii]
MVLRQLPRAIRAWLYGTALFRLVWDINTRGAQTMWWVMQYIFERRHSGKITFSGDKLMPNDSAIVISNHRSFTDFYMLHSVAIRKNMLPHVKYFAKDSLKYIPFFGFGMWLMGMLFIKRNWTQDEVRLNKMFNAIKQYRAPIWVVNFLEGTRMTPQKVREGQQFSKKRGLPILQNLLVPRTKGFIACLGQLRDTHVKFVYDFTIAYRHVTKGIQSPPNLVQVHSYSNLSPPWSFHVHVRKYAIEDLPRDEEKIAEWVKERFVEKDAILEDMKTHWTKSERLGEVHVDKYFK